jgi:NAD(P)H-hydrate epimerase
MQIYSAAQTHEWDEFTIMNEPISSLDLMERAAGRCYDWLMLNGYKDQSFNIFCGKGNNGGDGLVLARLIAETGSAVQVNIMEFGHKGTEDFQINLARLHETNVNVRFISTEETIQPIGHKEIVIDALFGSGLNRKLDGLNAAVVNHINRSGNEVIAIDIPSGLSADSSSKDHTIIKATHTLSFQQPKLAFLLPENQYWLGKLHILDIELHAGFHQKTDSRYQLVDNNFVSGLYKPRDDFGHKGTYGHALLIAGSYGKVGAAVLATNACLRSGAGLCTVHVPLCGYQVLQIAAPEAMTMTDTEERHCTAVALDIEKYTAIGIGPGLGTHPASAELLRSLITSWQKPLVLDADGLNLLSRDKALLELLPAGSVLTPHPKEFGRLFGESDNDYDLIKKAIENATRYNIVIVLKGHRTFIATAGKCFFNSTGNAGMATGGTGDVLTGIITGLLAQHYSPVDAAVLGVYLHGAAGDLAVKDISQEALIASDLIAYLGKAFLNI